MPFRSRPALVLGLALLACRREDDATQAAIAPAVQRLLLARVEAWDDASRALEAAAPLPAGRGWSTADDLGSIAAMRSAWHLSRTAYEQIEGALAPLFPESDLATDARYDHFLGRLGAAGDPDAFDERGVIGMHAIERVLWADAIPSEVVSFERGLPGYRAARFPQSSAEARAFKQQLARRLVEDVESLQHQLSSVEFDAAFAFRGLIDLAREQAEKVDRAATGQEESRYAQTTLKDLRDNRQGCLDVYRLFEPALLLRREGPALNDSVLQAFERLGVAYGEVEGDALPRPPDGFSGLHPTQAQLETPFGRLFAVVQRESDARRIGSLHAELVRVATVLELPEIVGR